MSAGMNVETAWPRWRGPAAYGHATHTRIFIPSGPRLGPDLKDSRGGLHRGGGELGPDYHTTQVSTKMIWSESVIRRRTWRKGRRCSGNGPRAQRTPDGTWTRSRSRWGLCRASFVGT